MDEVWVPTEFNRLAFTTSGVHPAKLFKVPEPVDVDLFDPATTTPLPLHDPANPIGKLIFGKAPSKSSSSDDNNAFRFLSVFKWEARKGWEILVRAYLREFSAHGGEGGAAGGGENVALYLLTNAFHTPRSFARQMKAIAKELSQQVNSRNNHRNNRAYVGELNSLTMDSNADGLVIHGRGNPSS
jgi:hypothetical protein